MEILEIIDFLSESLAIILAGFIVYKITKMEHFFSSNFRKPLRYFVAGVFVQAIAIFSELLSQHLLPNYQPLFADIRDVLLATGTIFLTIAVYKYSVLLLGKKPTE